MISTIRYQLSGVAPGRIGIRLIAASVLFSSLLALIITIIQFMQAYEREFSRVETNINLIENVYIENLSKVIWLMDEVLIVTQLQSILSFPEVESVSLRDDIDNSWDVGELVSSRSRSYDIQLTFEDQGVEKTVGKLMIIVGLDNIFKNLFYEVFFLLIANVTKALIVAVIMLLLFNRLITRHLTAISHWVSQFDITREMTPLTLPSGSSEHVSDARRNEILELFFGIMEMSRSLSNSWNSLDERFKSQTMKLDEAMRLTRIESEDRHHAQLLLSRVNQELENSNGRLEQLLDLINSHLLSVCVDADGRIVSLSAALCKRFDLEREPSIGQRCRTVLGMACEEAILSAITSLDGPESEANVVFMIKGKFGDEIWVHATIRAEGSSPTAKSPLYQVFLSDITAQKRAEKSAETDPLTGLGNRRSFEVFFANSKADAKLNRVCLLMALLDIDHFKQFNDSYGHAAGDECLQSVANSLRHNLRSQYDAAFRVGGEEFAIVCLIDAPEHAREIVEKLRQGIEHLAIPHKANSAAPVVTASFGYLVVSGNDLSRNLDELYRLTDRALYESKDTERNCSCRGKL